MRRTFAAAWLTGWGLFNTIEGAINHLLLGLHQVNEYAASPLAFDLLVQASGLVLILLGRAVTSESSRARH